jgi:hypothetical protein
MGMFSFGARDMSRELDKSEDDDMRNLKEKLKGLKHISIEASWDGHRLDAFLSAVATHFKIISGNTPSSTNWRRIPVKGQNHDDIQFTLLVDGLNLNFSLALGILYHPECPHTLHQDAAEGLFKKYKRDTAV